MPSAMIAILLASSSLLLAPPDKDTPANPPPPVGADPAADPGDSARFDSARALLDALAEKDKAIKTLSGQIRYTVINALQNDKQMRYGKLAIRNDDSDASADHRRYAVSFTTLEIDQRQEKIQEHYIFDGRWFVERLPQEKQFNKRELVPAGQTLDPMELMRDAPFWVSLGRDQDRLLASYTAQLEPRTDGLTDNPDFPELRFLADLPHVANTTQLKLTPKPGSGFEDDWEWVRIWINNDTLLPALYIKAEWTGDLQIVELFAVKTNTDIPDDVFDTTSPGEDSGWRVQISRWRGDQRDGRPQGPGNESGNGPGNESGNE